MLDFVSSLPISIADEIVGLPVAVVLVVIVLVAWRAISRGELLTGREHRALIAELEAAKDTAARERDEAKAEVRYWQSIALRALNVSEAALGRREAP